MVRINTQPKPIELGPAKSVTLTQSSSDPTVSYLTVELANPTSDITKVCSCPGFQYRRSCKHTIDLAG